MTTCKNCGVLLVVVFSDELCGQCRHIRNEHKVINSKGVIKMTCDQCPAVPGTHCQGCDALKGEYDDLSDAIQQMTNVFSKKDNVINR